MYFINPKIIRILIICFLVLLPLLNPAYADAPPETIRWSDNYVFEIRIPDPPKFFYPPKSTWCSCVDGGKWQVGASGSWGNASKIVPNALRASPGYFVLTTEGPGHLAYINAVEGDIMTISETNFVPCRFTIRKLSLDNPVIRGYFRWPAQ